MRRKRIYDRLLDVRRLSQRALENLTQAVVGQAIQFVRAGTLRILKNVWFFEDVHWSVDSVRQVLNVYLPSSDGVVIAEVDRSRLHIKNPYIPAVGELR